MDGFCLCVSPADCLKAFNQSSGNCSFGDQIRALYDLKPRWALVLGPSCGQQVDWPYSGGPLRDGSWLPNQVSCGVLDRLAPFKYRYNNSKTTIKSTRSTLEEGGDCHMGRASRGGASQCTVVAKNSTALTLSCQGSLRTLPRPLPSQVKLTSRNRTCDPTPTFTVGGKRVMAETSYGVPWRWSPSRLLARDLRFRLCGNDTRCPIVKGWTQDNFWSMMRSNTLFRPNPSNSLDQMFESSTPAQDSGIWSEPWMLCTSNSSGTDCQGTMSRHDWVQNKYQMCKAVSTLPNANEANVDLDVCNLDSSMNQLCATIQNARYRIFEANCQLTGQCRTTSYFYQPATYSIDDDKMVQNVVSYFYNYSVPGSCPVYDAETLRIIAQNQKTLQNCPAQDLEAIQLGLQLAREALYAFVKIAYYIGLIGIELLNLITATDTGYPLKMIAFYFNAIVGEFSEFFTDVGDAMYRLIMETGKLGQALTAIVKAVCIFLNETFFYVIQPMICMFQDAISLALDIFSSIVSALNFVSGGALGGFKDKVSSAQDTIQTFNCDVQNPFQCTLLDMPDGSMPSAEPMPTRCWVGYQPQIGDQQGLGCTMSDTCMDSDGSLKACAQCRAGAGVEPFGCDSLTKICRWFFKSNRKCQDVGFSNFFKLVCGKKVLGTIGNRIGSVRMSVFQIHLNLP